MEADDDDDTARFETIEQDAAEGRFELIELAVDGDAQGLKDSSRRMAPGPLLMARGARTLRARSVRR